MYNQNQEMSSKHANDKSLHTAITREIEALERDNGLYLLLSSNLNPQVLNDSRMLGTPFN